MVRNIPFIRRAANGMLGLLDILFLLSLLLVPVVWILNPLRWSIGLFSLTIHWGIKPVAAPALILAMQIILLAVLRRADPAITGPRTTAFRKVALTVIALCLAWTAWEYVLNSLGTKAYPPPLLLAGRNEQGDIWIQPDTEWDPELLWHMVPGTWCAGRIVNQMGFRERDVVVRKQPGTIRVLCMGDSVTAQGWPCYSQILHERLLRDPPTSQSWEAFNVGVYGYSSLQGLRLFQKLGRTLQPDVVTIFFGHNDCDRSQNGRQTDWELMALSLNPRMAAIYDTLCQKRSFALLIQALHAAAWGNFFPAKHTFPFRMRPEEYRKSLNVFVEEVRATGAVPVLITAPRRNLDARHYVNCTTNANQVHDQYVEITRRVARDRRVILLDLAALFADSSCDHYFSYDAMHFDRYAKESFMTQPLPPGGQPGLERIAEEIEKSLRVTIRSDEWARCRAKAEAANKP